MRSYSREVQSSPEKMVTNGRCRMGTFNQPFKEINLLDLEKPLGIPLPRFVNNLRLKEWEAFQMANEDWFICIAVFTAKVIGSSFIMIYEKKKQKLFWYRKQAAPRHFDVPSGLMNSTCAYKSSALTVEIRNKLDEGRFDISFKAPAFGDHPDCEGRFTAVHNTEPCVIVQPFADNKPLYSHKALMPGEGFLSMGGKKFQFEKGKSAVIIDDHKGYYPYNNFYDWLTTLGYQGDNLAGFNLTDNQILNPKKYNENCLWTEGRMVPLPPIKVERPEGLKNRWAISDEYGRVNLAFTPVCGEPVHKSIGFVSTYYYGPMGILEGHILNDRDETVVFDGMVGMGEKRHDRI